MDEGVPGTGWTSTLRATLFFSMEKLVRQGWMGDSRAKVGDCMRHRERKAGGVSKSVFWTRLAQAENGEE